MKQRAHDDHSRRKLTTDKLDFHLESQCLHRTLKGLSLLTNSYKFNFYAIELTYKKYLEMQNSLLVLGITMAGKNQHYLQRMMQRGFKRAESSRRNPSVWVYTKDQAPSIKRIEKTGAEDEFNSPVSENQIKTLDDKITDWEAHRQADVRAWRKLADGSAVDSHKAAELINVTGFRTRALRRSLETAIGELLAELVEALKDPEFLASYVATNKEFSESIHQQVYDTTGDPWQGEESPEYSLQFKAIIRMLTYAVSEVGITQLSELMLNLLPAFQDAFDVSNLNLPNSHRIAMEKYLDAEDVRDDLLEFNWFIKINSSHKEWILPDCAVVELSLQGLYSPFMFGDNEQRAAIMLPLGPTRVLVGTNVPVEKLDLTEFTEGAVKCSHEFFISSKNIPELDRARNHIGSAFANSISEIIEDTLQGSSSLRSSNKQDHKSAEYIPPKSVKFLTHHLEISDGDLSIISERMMSYIKSVGKLMDLSRIQSVVLCSDIVSAFTEMENVVVNPFHEEDMRRFVWWREIGGETLGYRLYLQTASIEVLCNTEDESFEFTLNLLLQSLYQIHMRSIIVGSDDTTEALSRYTNSDTGSPIRDIAIQSACAYLDALFGARTAGFEPKYLKDFEDRAHESLTKFYAQPIPDTMCPATNDQYTEDIANALGEVIYDLARLLAVSRDLNQYGAPEAGETPFAQIIATHNLYDWINRLRLNLHHIHKNFHTGLDPQLFRPLQLDAERLLWDRGMVAIAEEEGSRLLPFENPNITYASLSSEITGYIGKMLPKDTVSALTEHVARSASLTST